MTTIDKIKELRSGGHNIDSLISLLERKEETRQLNKHWWTFEDGRNVCEFCKVLYRFDILDGSCETALSKPAYFIGTENGIEDVDRFDGLPGYEKPDHKNPFFDALLDNTDQLIKSQLVSDFKVIELQNKLDAANAKNKSLQNKLDALDKLSSALSKELIDARCTVVRVLSERSELLLDLSIKEGIIEDQRDQW